MTATATFVAAASTHSGTTSPASVDITWPGGLQANDTAIVISSVNNTSGTGSPPSGFAAYGAIQTLSTVLTSALYSKTLAGTESGTLTVASPTGFSGRMAAGLIIWRGADLSQAFTTAQTTTNATNQSIAAITPSSDAFIAAILGYNTQANGTGFAPPAGWTERVDSITTNTTGNCIGTSIFTKDAAVTGGVSSGTATSTVDTVLGRSNAFTLAVRNGTVVVSPGWQMGSISMGH